MRLPCRSPACQWFSRPASQDLIQDSNFYLNLCNYYSYKTRLFYLAE